MINYSQAEIISAVSLTCNGIGNNDLSFLLEESNNNLIKGKFEIPKYDLDDYVKLRTKCLDQCSSHLILGISKLIEKNKSVFEGVNPERVGLILGTNKANKSVLEKCMENNEQRPLPFIHSFINAPIGLAAQIFNLQGVHSLLCSGDNSAMQTLKYSIQLLNSNKADLIICGGFERNYIYKKNDDYTINEGVGLLLVGKKTNKIQDNVKVFSMGCAVNKIPNEYAFKESMQNALSNGNLNIEDISIIILASHEDELIEKMEIVQLKNMGFSENNVINIQNKVGRIGAAQAGVSLAYSYLLAKSNHDAKRKIMVNSIQGNSIYSTIVGV